MILANQDLERELRENGFVLMDANITNEIQLLETYINEHFQLPSTGFYYSLLNNNLEQNRILSDFISNTLDSFYKNNFIEYKIRTQSFLAKIANNKEELFLHQDWNYTDERNFRAYNVWIPLDNVTAENGALFFIPGSHLWFENLRSGSLPTARLSYEHFPKEYIRKIEVRKGQVVVFHPAVFHGSFPNNTATNRITVTATIFEHQAPFLYYHFDKAKKQITVYQLEDESFLKDLEYLAFGKTTDSRIIHQMDYSHKELTIENLLNHRL